jgi:2-methylcitrate dehydratase PrpD
MSGDPQARYRDAFLDWMACAVGGLDHPAAIAANGAGDGPLERVTAAGTAGHVLDFDDTYLPGIAHLSAPTAPAALMLGAELGATVGEVLDAYAAGFEAAGAMALSAHPALYDGGWHPTAVCGAIGAAVSAAGLLGLGAEARRSAIGLALLRAGGLRSAFGSAGKSLQVGMAASAGVAAARLADAGAAVDLDRIAGGPAGFEAAFGAAFGQPGSSPAIGENWIKAYPCCLQTHAAIEAALLAREAEAVDGGEPSGLPIEVTVPPIALQAAWVKDPGDGLEAKFSIPYLTAYALLRGAPNRHSFAAVDDSARGLAATIAVQTDATLGDSATRLTVGAEQSFAVEAALGSPQRPLSAEALAAKRRDLAGGRLEGALDDRGAPAAVLREALGI